MKAARRRTHCPMGYERSAVSARDACNLTGLIPAFALQDLEIQRLLICILVKIDKIFNAM